MPPKEKKEKDKKLTAKEKEEAKKQKKAQKAEKTTAKRNKKDAKDIGEEDIESIIAKFNEKERQRTAVTVTVCAQPSPRSNFSMTALPNGEMLMFGGEFCDGQGTVVFNDLFRWNLERQEWRQLESLNTPPPRCSHQAVCFKDKLYIFGGEYATLDQFHHYSDMWALDLKTNTWTEIPKPRGKVDWPSPRSGHRMVLWRGHIVLFGGFFEAVREVRWYNDLFIFSFQEERWAAVPYRPHTPVPKPRSGFLMCLHATDDVLYVHGGYSREKRAAAGPGGQQKKSAEGVVHQDTWMMILKPALGSGAGAAAKGKLDTSRLTWQKVSRKGAALPARCGAVVVPFKNKAVVFGGVMDQEGLGHSMVSTFYNDIYAFDLDRKRWYQLGLKSKRAATGEKKKKKKSVKAADSEGSEGSDDGSDAGSEAGEDDEERRLENGDFFGYIDESGNVVYLDLNAPDPEDGDGKPSAEGDIAKEGEEPTVFQFGEMAAAVPAESKAEAATKPESKGVELFIAPTASTQWATEGSEPPPPLLSAAMGAAGLAKYFGSLRSPAPRINPCLVVRGTTLYVYGGVTELGDIEVTLDDCWTLDLNKRDSWKNVLPGTMQTLNWRGEADDSTSARSDDYDSEEDDYGFSDDEEDEEDGASVLEEGDDEEGSEGDDAVAVEEKTEASPAVVVMAESPVKDKKHREKNDIGDKKERSSRLEPEEGPMTAGMRLKSGHRDRNAPRSAAGGAGLMAEINTICAELPNEGAEEENPLPAESLREFFGRTSVHWKARAVEDWQQRNASSAPVELTDEQAELVLKHQQTHYGRVVEVIDEASSIAAPSSLRISDAFSDKDIKRIAFELADARFQEVLPIMERLRELEGQLEEDTDAGRPAGRGSRGASKNDNPIKKTKSSAGVSGGSSSKKR